MADYNIYIHNVNGESATDSPVKAWSGGNTASQTKAWQPSSQSSSQDGGDGFSFSKLFKTAELAFKGSNFLSKSVPIVAAAIAAYQAAQKVTSIANTLAPFVSRETGDYDWQFAAQNVKSCLNAVGNPVGTIMANLQARQEAMLFNKRAEQERLLVGEGYLNSGVRRS